VPADGVELVEADVAAAGQAQDGHGVTAKGEARPDVNVVGAAEFELEDPLPGQVVN
jgi:hypothetical protein